jgi:hypothetical protein
MMPAFLVLPPDLTPTALVYRDDLPEDIDDVIEDCLERWRRGDIDSAIGRAKEAQMLAEAYHHHISISVTSVLLMDLYREQDQLGLLPLGPQLRMKANDALRLQPGYEHRHHAEAVIDYLWGLLNHISGTNIGALSDYKRALASFEDAVEHWKSNIVRNPTQASKYKEQIGKCDQASKWIKALRGSLVDDLSASRARTEVHIPAPDGRVYKLVRLKLAAPVPPPRAPSPVVYYLRPQEALIDKDRYQLYNPSNGIAYRNNLKILGGERHFALCIPEKEWAGAQSEEGDYVMVKQELQVTQPGAVGVLWDDDQQEWEYGKFVRDLGTGEIRFRPLPPIMFGGKPLEEDIKDKDTGSVWALLKPA